MPSKVNVASGSNVRNPRVPKSSKKAPRAALPKVQRSPVQPSMDQKMGNPRAAAAAMKKYKAEVAQRKNVYASTDRLNAAAKAAGKKPPKMMGRSMPARPRKGRGY